MNNAMLSDVMYRRRGALLRLTAVMFAAAVESTASSAQADPRSSITGEPAGQLVRTLYGDDLIQVAYLPGDNDQAVVAFNGAEYGLGGIPLAEYRNTVPRSTNHIYTVTDRTRHWYNSSAAQLVELLNADFAYRGIKKVITLGNSLGGFGAIFFASQLKGCHKAIAFSAQSAVDPSIVPWETRFRAFTAGIKHWNGLDAVTSLQLDIAYFLFFGSEDPFDVRHARRFADVNNASMTVYLINDSGHDVAFDLEKRGALRFLMEAMMQAESPCVDLGSLMKGFQYQLLRKPAGCI